MFVWDREQLQNAWKAVQRRKGRQLGQTATAFRVGMHASEGIYKKYIKGMTEKLAKTLNGDSSSGRDEVEAFFSKLDNTRAI